MPPPRPEWVRILNDAEPETAELILRLHLEDVQAEGRHDESDSESESATDSDETDDETESDGSSEDGDTTFRSSSGLHDIESTDQVPCTHRRVDSTDSEVDEWSSDDDLRSENEESEDADDDMNLDADSEIDNIRSFRANALIFDELDRLPIRSTAPSPSPDTNSELEDHNDQRDEPESEGSLSSSESDSLPDDVSETSSLAAYAVRNESDERSCIICGDKCSKYDSCLLECGDYHCEDCLNQAFRLALKDKSAYPPRCCGNEGIEFHRVKWILHWKLVDQFEGKQEELDDPRPSYCFRNACSAYIPESFKEGTRGECRECFNDTCILCRQQWHSGDCRNDEQIEQTLQLAKDRDWQKCPGCDRIVELVLGCNHVTCLCGFEFCYTCRAKWKTCACEQFTERRLMANGERIV